LRFSDFVDLKLRGTVDADPDSRNDSAAERKATAYHEAGHAAMTMIAWDGEQIPDYASIIPNTSAGNHFAGVVFADVGALSRTRSLTFLEMRRMVRKMLAGRAGEEILGGAAEISNGAMSDLSKATEMVMEAFSRFGFSPNMDERPGQNLAVILELAISKEDRSGHSMAFAATDLLTQRARISEMVRSFLEVEYNATVSLLTEHRGLLDAIAERLLRSPILGREELRGIMKKHTKW
jgi:ATP-dependent Zn protease